MGKKQRTLRKLLFRYYSRMIFVLLLILYGITLVYYVREQVGEIRYQQRSLCVSVQNSIDASVEKMSIVSMNVLYAESIRDTLKQTRSGQISAGEMRPVYDTIASIIGPYGTVTQVDVHSIHDLAVGWGNYELCRQEAYLEIPWYQEICRKDGAKFIAPPVYRSDLAYYNRYLQSKKFLSLYRMFFDDSYKEEGIVEVIQDCDKFFADVRQLEENNPGQKIYVWNEKGEYLYPYETDEELLAEEAKTVFLQEKGEFQHLLWSGNQFVSGGRMEDCGWMIAVTQNGYEAFRPMLLVLAAYLLIGSVFIGSSLMACYRISNVVTEPLNRLKQNIEQIDLNDLVNHQTVFEPVNAGTSEVEMLSAVFAEMYEKLGSSAASLLCAREEELRAKMIATQSMVNPHFIFNNLANISVMAEENMNAEITQLCRDLCDYLRYIAADGMATVDVATEIFYTKKYLECIKVRYGKRLEWSFCIPEELAHMPISKLSLQPLVENAQKYAFRTKPPWKIAVEGSVKGGWWTLSVSDNGIGIKEEYIREIYENLEHIRREKDVSSMKIGGMGLANVYLRLILLYGDEASLLIENRKDGGATVTLRAKTDGTERFERRSC